MSDYFDGSEEPSIDVDDVRRRFEELAQRASRYGLHLAEAAAIHAQGQSASVVGAFTVGKLAWSDDVQNPKRAEENVEFKQLEKSFHEDEFERFREEARRRLEGNGDGS